MALIIEDGSGLNPAANSYITVADFRIGARVLGYDFDTKLNSELETFLREGIETMQRKHSSALKGYRAVSGQPLDWPRKDVQDDRYMGMFVQEDSIPSEVVNAQIGYALAYFDDLTEKNTEQTGTLVKRKIGSLEEVYSTESVTNNFTPFDAKAEAHLHPFLKKGGLTLIRA